MGWESRGGAGRYYTRSRRVGGRVVREYVGTGPAAELAAASDALARAERAARARQWNDLLAAVEAAAEPLAAFARRTDDLARAALVAAGYHRHDRGEWRRRDNVRKREPARPAGRRPAPAAAAACGAG